MQVACTQCGKVFSRKPSQFKKYKTNFCNRDCKAAWQAANVTGDSHPNWSERVSKICERCGKEFLIIPSRAKRAHYCSKACQDGSRLPKQCERCGKEFLVEPSTYNRTRFCSRACKHPEHTVIKCKTCGRTFEVITARQHSACFCSLACANEWQKGQNSYSWKGGVIHQDYYGPDWPAVSMAVRKRDNHTCQRCGLHQTDHRKAFHVHHIVPLRSFLPDRGDQAHALANLVLLCPQCHNKVERGAPLYPD